MKNLLNYLKFFFCIFTTSVLFIVCSKNDDIEPFTDPDPKWDIEKQGIPKIVSANYIELEKIYQISKFRSSIGHDYSDDYEQCRSMKHYFEPKSMVDWSTVKIFSPLSGTIASVVEEWAGTKLEIKSNDYPAFRVTIFHIKTLKTFTQNDSVKAGEQIGTQIGSMTMSDIAVSVTTPENKRKLLSYFEVMTDAVFNEYVPLGVTTRQSMIITKDLRDANPLVCSGESFTASDLLPGWVILNDATR